MNENLRRVIADALDIPVEQVTEATSVENEEAWDSLRHMIIIFGLEDAFGIRFTDDEITQLVSASKIDEIIAGKLQGN